MTFKEYMDNEFGKEKEEKVELLCDAFKNRNPEYEKALKVLAERTIQGARQDFINKWGYDPFR